MTTWQHPTNPLNSKHPRPLLLRSTAPSRLSPSIALWPWWPWPRRAPCHGRRRLAGMSSQLRLLQIPSRIPPPSPPTTKKKVRTQYFSLISFLGGKYMRFKTTRASRNRSCLSRCWRILRPSVTETLDASRHFLRKLCEFQKQREIGGWFGPYHFATGFFWLCMWVVLGFLGTLHWRKTQQLSKKWQRTSFNKNH